MTKKIKRYLLLEDKVEDMIFAEMHKNFNILKIDRVGDKIFLYSLEDEKQEKENVKFFLFLTGHSLDDENLKYIGSFNSKSLSMTFHVFIEN